MIYQRRKFIKKTYFVKEITVFANNQNLVVFPLLNAQNVMINFI